MKFLKITLFAFLLASASACLKAKNDFAGMRTDPGEVVTAILEQQYLTGDANNLNFGYGIYASFDFGAPATESVRFFTLHISQPKAKVSGNLIVKISAVAAPGAILPPAGALTFPTEISIPAQGGVAFDFPVRFTVNKATLNPSASYGITFTITGVNQGIYSELEKSVDVYINDAKFLSRYKNTSTISDANDLFEVDNNVTTSVILEDVAADRFDAFDFYLGNYAVIVANKTTGAVTSLFTPRYQVDAVTGKLLKVLNKATNADLAATIDPSSGWVYTANDNRTFIAKYTVTLTVASVARAFTINEKYEWVAPQAF